MTLKIKKYTIKWDNGKTTVAEMTSEQAKNLRETKMVKSVTLKKK